MDDIPETKVVILNSSTLTPDRSRLLKWIAKTNGKSEGHSVGGMVKVICPDGHVRMTSATSGEYKTIQSRDGDLYDDMAHFDEAMEWSREEILCFFDSAPRYVVFDEIGPEVLHGMGLDAALRSCLWRMNEEQMTNTTLVLVVEPSMISQLPDLYSLSDDQVTFLGSMSSFLEWLKPVSREQRQYNALKRLHRDASMLDLRRPVSSGTLSSPSARVSRTDSLDSVENPNSVLSLAGVGTVYDIIKYPLLFVTGCIIATEFTLYLVVRQAVSLIENLTRRHSKVYNKMKSATSYNSWRRSARELDALDGKHGGHAEIVPLVTQFTDRLATDTNRLNRQSRNAQTERMCYNANKVTTTTATGQLGIEQSTGISSHAPGTRGIDGPIKSPPKFVLDSNGLALHHTTQVEDCDVGTFSKHEHQLVRTLRELAVPSFSELTFAEHLYTHNHTGINVSVSEYTQQILRSLNAAAVCDPAALLAEFFNSPHSSDGEVSFNSGSNRNSFADIFEDVAGANARGRRLSSHMCNNNNNEDDDDSDDENVLDVVQVTDTDTLNLVDDINRKKIIMGATFDQTSLQYKSRLFAELASSFGESALCLSGGASNCYFHLGVIKALQARKVLPKHVSGASGGALVGSFLCTHTDEQLTELLTPEYLSKIFNPIDPSYWSMFERAWKVGTLFDKEDWATKLKNQVCGTYTFKEAYELTGRSFTVTVFNVLNGKQHTRALNYKTTPDVVIYSAVLASAAIPKLLPAIELLRKDSRGAITPYTSLGRFWRDGSFENELPFEALHQMFNVTFTIVSQVEPHISPFFYENRGSAGAAVAHRKGHGWRGGFLLSYAERLLKLDLKKWLELIREFHLLPKIFDTDFSSVFLGRTFGSVTTVAPTWIRNYLHLVDNPSTKEKMHVYMLAGQQITWPKLGMIEDRMRVEKRLGELSRSFATV